ncbi:MAG: DNA translocase FtsK, partial [Chloroflexi bacterium]|nr:DNA translocase FtsK [Chloroflexota bacterium]
MAKGKGKLGWFFRVFTAPVRRLLLVALIVALLLWQWPTVTGWTERTAQEVWDWGGWGLIILGGAIAIFLTMVWLQKLSWFLHHWNHWLGGSAFALASWGILGILSQGGEVGRSLSDGFAVTGFLKVAGLIVVGVFLVAPRAFLGFIKNSALWSGRRLKTLAGKVKAPPMPQPPLKRKPKVAAATTQASEARAEAPSPEDLRQVAQEVWKKYGESPASITENGWRIPPIDILDKTRETEFNQADNNQRARLIEEALASYNVDAKVVQINVGPTVTQFGVEPGWDKKFKEVREKDRDGNVKTRLEETTRTRVKVERITSLANDLALALAAPTIRIEAPVPGKSVVGIEVPNATSSMVSLRGVIETSAFQKLKPKSKLSIALGEGAGGEAVAADLAKMPHLLIAGATGSGKTVCLNTIICCILM